MTGSTIESGNGRYDARNFKPGTAFEARRAYIQVQQEAAASPEVAELIATIEQAGPVMVIDPEKAIDDLPDTLERTRIAARLGLKVIIIGGSTDSGESTTVVPAVRDAIDEVDGPTRLLAFPGSSRQVVPGVHASLLLHLPQIYPVFAQRDKVEQFLSTEFMNIIAAANRNDIPLIPVQYILFHAGVPTTVEKITGISAINVIRDGMDIQAIMETMAPWCKPGELAMLELGSSPGRSINLAPIAEKVYEATGIIPLITGGINKPEHVRERTSGTRFPLGFGSLQENTPPDQFEEVYRAMRAAHPLTRAEDNGQLPL